MRAAALTVLAALGATGPTSVVAAAEGAGPARALPAFDGRIAKIDPKTRGRMKGVSMHAGCPVGFRHLRLLKAIHVGFDRRAHRGRLIVHRDSARGMLRVLRRLYRLRFPIRRMRLVDAYGGQDRRSMNADNTSAFNCRHVAGQPGVWSEHAYGRAIDINPVENPYVTSSGFVSPPAGAPFARRGRPRRGMVHRQGPVVAAFAAVGWEWGGNWVGVKDYQHFSATGR